MGLLEAIAYILPKGKEGYNKEWDATVNRWIDAGFITLHEYAYRDSNASTFVVNDTGLYLDYYGFPVKANHNVLLEKALQKKYQVSKATRTRLIQCYNDIRRKEENAKLAEKEKLLTYAIKHVDNKS